jgi:hypothetical protein
MSEPLGGMVLDNLLGLRVRSPRRWIAFIGRRVCRLP